MPASTGAKNPRALIHFSLTPSADPGIGLSGDRVGWAGNKAVFGFRGEY